MSDPWSSPHPSETSFAAAYDEPPTKNSGLGLSALLVGIATWVIGGIPFVALMVMGAMAEINQEPLPAEDDPMVALGGCAVLLGLLIALIGTGLGIAGCFISGRRKLFAVLGLVANGAFLLIASFLILLGLAMGA